ncbi:MAG: hypothetical protein ABFD66_02060 [Smithella sp.]
METMLKHVGWDWYGKEAYSKVGPGAFEFVDVHYHGRVGVRVDGDKGRIEVKILSGKEPLAGLLYPILNATLPEGWKEECEKLHLNRKNPWKVERRVGMSECIDYRIRILHDTEWKNAPIVAGIHVSMSGRLNKGLNLWLGDLPPLLGEFLKDFGGPLENSYIQVYDPELPRGFSYPGDDYSL